MLIATAPLRDIRSYWINGFSTTMPHEKGFRSKLHEFVADAERAARDPPARKVWINDNDDFLWRSPIGHHGCQLLQRSELVGQV